MVSKLTAAQVRGMLCYTARELMGQKQFLTEVDSAIGDGDHGIGMYGGMEKSLKKLETLEDCEDCYALFAAVGKTMLLSMGGASGVLFGTLFLAGTKGKAPSEVLTAGDLAELFRAGLREIKQRGKAQPGDKTMVDALEPAVLVLEAGAPDGDIAALLQAAERAAAEGVERTKGYQAKFGRAKSLQERAIGHQDAGATSVWLTFRAMAGCVLALDKEEEE